MTLAEAAEIFRHWQAHPPTYRMIGLIAGMLGYKPSLPPSRAIDLGGAAPPGLGLTGGDLGMPAPMLDAAAMRAKNRARAVTIARENIARFPVTPVTPHQPDRTSGDG